MKTIKYILGVLMILNVAPILGIILAPLFHETFISGYLHGVIADVVLLGLYWFIRVASYLLK